MKALDLADQIDHTLTKLNFLNTMFGAWNVDEIPVSFDDMAGIQLFMDDIIDEVKSYGEVMYPSKITSLPNTA
jgi:hypothetical protein